MINATCPRPTLLVQYVMNCISTWSTLLIGHEPYPRDQRCLPTVNAVGRSWTVSPRDQRCLFMINAHVTRYSSSPLINAAPSTMSAPGQLSTLSGRLWTGSATANVSTIVYISLYIKVFTYNQRCVHGVNAGCSYSTSSVRSYGCLYVINVSSPPPLHSVSDQRYPYRSLSVHIPI